MEKNVPHVATVQNCCVTAQETLFFTHVLKSVVAQPDLGAGILLSYLFIMFSALLPPPSASYSFPPILSSITCCWKGWFLTASGWILCQQHQRNHSALKRH